MRTNSTSRRRNNKNRRSAVRSFVTVLQIAVLLSMGVLAGTALGWFAGLSRTLPDINAFEAPEATLVYSSDGVLLGRVFRENRTNVALKDIPKELREATVAIEDKRFYEHSGVDMRGVARAVYANIRGQRMAQGGSTITQQLARNVYLTQRKTIQRKLQEIFLAILIERNFSKDRILELYLNQIFYGSGAFGVQAASRIYFGKDVQGLNLSECALIAGLPQKPSGYSPHENLNAAVGRRNTVLATMADLGYITEQQQAEAREQQAKIVPRRSGRTTYKAPHFVDYVNQRIKERYGEDVLYGGGLRVYTTLNWEMQQAAEKALRVQISSKSKTYRATEGCLIALDPNTGGILAMVGSVDPESHYNRCTQAGRQPGSAFKVFVYTAALADGWKPSTRLPNTRVSYPAGRGRTWNPRNYDGRYGGSVTMDTAVAKSINLPAIYTAKKVGVKNVIKYARLMGVRSPLEPYLPIAIGGIPGVHPIEMASAYCTFANDGIYTEPIGISKITNSRGETQAEFTPDLQQVISKNVSRNMDQMLRGVVTKGTGTGAASVAEARGKTGTTNNERDVWFIGYVPKKIVCAVWVGNDNNSSMRGATGGGLCIPVWREFMSKAIPVYNEVKTKAEQAASKNKPKPADEQPKGDSPPTENQSDDDDGDVVRRRICTQSDMLATSTCPHWRTKTFTKGTEPIETCSVHGGTDISIPPEDSNPASADREAPAQDTEYVTITVCSQSGLLAGRYCPRTKRKLAVEDVPTQVCNIRHDQMRE
ncbi:MAG: PBP1A family penicillin-binding protein [Armatimonadetes bacterium]|nr:PBP1A family penicillin-binding protein [Armatimonadota bacterium]